VVIHWVGLGWVRNLMGWIGLVDSYPSLVCLLFVYFNSRFCMCFNVFNYVYLLMLCMRAIDMHLIKATYLLAYLLTSAR